MPAKKGKPPDRANDRERENAMRIVTARMHHDDPWTTPDTRKRMSSGDIEVDDATGALTKMEEKIFNPESKRWVSLESLTGKTLMVDILRNEVSDLRTQLDISKFNMDDILEERNALQREVELLRIAVKDADKQDNDIHLLEETIVEKDKKIAELLNLSLIHI